MSGVSAYEMLAFCTRSFALGAVFWVIYHLMRGIVRLLGDALFNIVRLSQLSDLPKFKNMLSFARLEAKSRTVNYEVYNVVYVLLVSVIYCVYSYIFLDGAFRVLPLCVLGAAVALLNFLVPNTVIKKVNDLSSSISVLLILPLVLIFWAVRSITHVATKCVMLCRKKSINSPMSSKNAK